MNVVIGGCIKMNKRLKDKLLLFFFSFILGLLVFQIYFMTHETTFCKAYFFDSEDINITMFEDSILDNGETERWLGYYRHDSYFCVATKGRSDVDIAETTYHELAHHFNYNDPEHFCGQY